MDIIKRVILSYKRRFVKRLKRRTAIQRYKAKLYYRKHKTKIKLWRKKYLRKNKIFLKTRKLFKRTKPVWLLKRKKRQIYKPKIKMIKRPKVKNIKIKKPRLRRRIYVPKRRKRE
jgi:hypothetical protein